MYNLRKMWGLWNEREKKACFCARIWIINKGEVKLYLW